MKRLISLTLLALLLTACQATPAGNNTLSGRILLWHGWDETDTQALDHVLDNFAAIYPDVTVVHSAIPAGELRQQYEERAEMGLGPSLFLGSNDWLRELATADLIRPLHPDNLPQGRYLSAAIDGVRYDGITYGLPLSLHPVALYYNTELVTQPATTLDELLSHAANGQQVALNTNFDSAFWGVQTFGGQLLDEEGRVVLDQGGFANWLGWLKNAQTAPGMILSRDSAALRDLFLNGDVAYFVGEPDLLTDFQATLGEDLVSATILPAGPNGSAGPLLNLEVIYLNQANSDEQHQLALTLAHFLTNTEQSLALLREAQRVPANQNVRVDSRVYPHLAGFSAQARTAVAVPTAPQMAVLQEEGNATYRQVIEGVTGIIEGTYALTNSVNEQFGFATVSLPESTCELSGTIDLWHSWSGSALVYLRSLLFDYSSACPGVVFRLRAVQEDIFIDSLTARPPDERPDLLLLNSDYLLPLVDQGLVAPLDTRIPEATWQRFVPAGQTALQYQNSTYGLPVALHLNALFVNTTQAPDPPATIDDLTRQTTTTNLALPLNFHDLYWSLTAFAGPIFDSNLTFIADPTALADWLAWVQTAQSPPTIIAAEDRTVLSALFTAGSAAYYVGSADELAALEEAQGETLRVVPLPAGPAGTAQPILTVDALFLSSASNRQQQDLALAFADFATNRTNQARLMTDLRFVPANVIVETGDDHIIAGFLAQAQNATVLPPSTQLDSITESATVMIRTVMSGQVEPLTAACQFILEVNSDLPAGCDP